MTEQVHTLRYIRAPHPTPLGLASQLGWFLEEFHDDGIKVFTLPEQDTPAPPQALHDKTLRYTVRQGGNMPAIWARSEGHPTRVIGMNWLEEYQGIVSLPRSGIRQPRDLRGRRLGLPLFNQAVEGRRAEALRGFCVALEAAGLHPRDIELVDVPHHIWPCDRADGAYAGRYAEYAPLFSALERGEVDSIYVKGARGLQATREARANVVMDVSAHPDPLVRVHTGGPRPIVVHQALLDENPDLVVRFLGRVVAIGPWAAGHPAETLAYMSRETRTSENWVRAAYGDELHRFQRTELDATSIRALEVHKDFLLKEGFIANDFDVGAWIDPRPLADVVRSRRRPVTALAAVGAS